MVSREPNTKKKELEDFANAWEAEGFFVVRRDSMK
jgi:hypothetical protein